MCLSGDQRVFCFLFWPSITWKTFNGFLEKLFAKSKALANCFTPYLNCKILHEERFCSLDQTSVEIV